MQNDDWTPGRRGPSLLPDRLPPSQDLSHGLDTRPDFEKGNADAHENPQCELPPYTKGGPNDD